MSIYNFTVLKVSQKGALLISDGSHIAWVQSRARRKDGTFGDGALRALLASKIQGSTLQDFEAFNNQIVSVNLKWMPRRETEKAWLCGFSWFPKSLCSLTKNEDKTFTISGPRWVLLKEYEEYELVA